MTEPAPQVARPDAARVRVAFLGCGMMARVHMRIILAQTSTTEILVLSDPSDAAYREATELFTSAGLEAPPNQPDLGRLLADYGDRLDAVFIVTPHALHHDQAAACLAAGLDVLLEKPMVMNAAEARSLIETRDRTGRLLVVAFQGSLSPHVRTAVRMLRSGELGSPLNITAITWQNWAAVTAGTWRQIPAVAGGGFLFDTGAHMLNTVSDLAGQDFAEVSAWLSNGSAPVDLLASVSGRLVSGVLVTMAGCGATIQSCDSDVRVYCTRAILRTGIWGERLELQREGRSRFRKVKVPPSRGVWEQFLAVRRGEIPNPCPPEVGLRMARLWDAIQASAAQNGAPVQCA